MASELQGAKYSFPLSGKSAVHEKSIPATTCIYLFVLLLAALFAQGCVIIPTLEDKVLVGRQVTEQQLAFIRSGVTAKSEIVEHLGEPDVFWEDERIFAYNWSMRWGIFIMGGAAPVPAGVVEDLAKHYVLVIRFDPKDRVERFEVTTPSAFDSYGHHLEKWLKQKKDPPENEALQGSDGK